MSVFELDRIILGVPEVSTARDFYAAALSPNDTVYDHTIDLDARGITLDENPAARQPGAGLGGFIISYVLTQPTEVRGVLEAAVANGATMLRPAKKGFFGGFSAVFRAPDGSIWKLAAPTKKDTGPATDPPLPTEIGVILAVSEPRKSQAFYSGLGMTVDRDYGDKFIDFQLTAGKVRFGLMPPRPLAKDVGVAEGEGSGPVVLRYDAADRDEVDGLLGAAEAAGGRITEAGTETDDGYRGRLTDPDGHLWNIVAS